MPRTPDPEKDKYAEILLSQGKPIAQIRSELKRIFGSSISPNRLLLLKKQIQQSHNKEKIMQNIPIPFLIKKTEENEEYRKLDEILERTTQNTIIIHKLWGLLQNFQKLMNFLIPTIEDLNLKLEKIETNFNLEKAAPQENISEQQIIEELEKRKAMVMDYLMTHGHSSFNEISEVLQMDETLLRWAIEELKTLNIIKLEQEGKKTVISLNI